MGWNHNTQRELVLRIADELEKELAVLPAIKGDTFQERDAARKAYNAALSDLKARLMARKEGRPTTMATDWQGARFAALGFRATSTMGLAGAIRNWITQVRAKAMVHSGGLG